MSPPEGLLHWWAGDGTGEDFAGSSDAVLLGTAGFGTGFVTSGGGQAFNFDGSNDGMARVQDTPDLNPTGPPGFTVDAWANLRSFEPNAGAVLGKGGHQAESYAMDHIGTEYRGFIRLEGDGSSVQIRFPAELDQWTHLALTWDGDSLRFYVNGAEVGALQATSINSTSGAFLGIGSRQEAPPTVDDFEFNGLIDEVEYFGRALGPSEIQAIFNAGTAGKCKQADSVAVQLTPSRREVRPVLARIFNAVRQSTFNSPDDLVGEPRVDTMRLQLQVSLEPSGNLPDSARVLLRSEPVDTSGGHAHDLGARPTGTFFADPNPPVSDSTAGARDSVRLLLVDSGDTSVVYRSSGVSGIERLRVEVTAFRGGDTLMGTALDSVLVRWRPDLVAMDRIGAAPDTTYQFSNQDPALPGQRHGNRNHWIEPGFRDRVLELFTMYFDLVQAADRFPIANPGGTFDTRFVITDVSLKWGGLLDIDTTPWRNPHKRHRTGEDMDVRIRTMDDSGRDKFQLACDSLPALACDVHPPPHWHLLAP